SGVSLRLTRAGATVGLLLGIFVVALDGTIMATPLPRIAAELGALHYYVWVTTGYLVTSTVVLSSRSRESSATLSDAAPSSSPAWSVHDASVRAGLSQTMAELVFLRAVQGLFGGVLFAVPVAAVGWLRHPRRRGSTTLGRAVAGRQQRLDTDPDRD